MVLLAFLFALVVSLAALVLAVIRGIGLYKQAKRTGRAVSGPLESFEALARLQRSRAQLQLLLDSIERAKARLHWLRVFLPAR